MTSARADRLPDFIIIGAAKSGTTSLFNWLSQQPEVAAPKNEGARLLLVGAGLAQRHGVDSALFAHAAGKVCGEASTSYTELRHAETAAARMAATVPDIKLIYALRDPVERLRSHFRHEVQHGRERGTLATAVAEPDNEYVGSSLYFTCLQPYVRLFARDQICVVRFEDLVDAHGSAWAVILDHLDLSARDKPVDALNRTADKPGLSPSFAKLKISDSSAIRHTFLDQLDNWPGSCSRAVVRHTRRGWRIHMGLYPIT